MKREKFILDGDSQIIKTVKNYQMGYLLII